MKQRLLNTCRRVAVSTAATAGIMFVLLAGLNWIWVLGHHDPSLMEETLWQYFGRCMLVTILLVGIQIGVLSVAGASIAVARGRHNMAAMIFSGVLLLALNALAPSIGFLPDSMPRRAVYVAGFPLAVLALQWLPERQKRLAPNKRIEDER